MGRNRKWGEILNFSIMILKIHKKSYQWILILLVALERACENLSDDITLIHDNQVVIKKSSMKNSEAKKKIF